METDVESHSQTLGGPQEIPGRIVGDRGTKDTMENHKESNDLGLWGLTETESPSRENTWNSSGPSAHVLHLSDLVFLWESFQREQRLSLILFYASGILSSYWLPFLALIGEEVPRHVATCLTDVHGRYDRFWREGRGNRWGVRLEQRTWEEEGMRINCDWIKNN